MIYEDIPTDAPEVPAEETEESTESESTE